MIEPPNAPQPPAFSPAAAAGNSEPDVAAPIVAELIRVSRVQLRAAATQLAEALKVDYSRESARVFVVGEGSEADLAAALAVQRPAAGEGDAPAAPASTADALHWVIWPSPAAVLEIAFCERVLRPHFAAIKVTATLRFLAPASRTAPLGMIPFGFTPGESPDVAGERFIPWLDDVIANAILQWRIVQRGS